MTSPTAAGDAAGVSGWSRSDTSVPGGRAAMTTASAAYGTRGALALSVTRTSDPPASTNGAATSTV